jgi:hypothetical protein
LAAHEPEYLKFVNTYLELVGAVDCPRNTLRNELEYEIAKLNEGIMEYMEKMIDDLQKLHPGYIKTFRTDGIECDIYIGQSITPQLKFDGRTIRAYRALQLRYMALVAKHTDQMSLLTPLALKTTQLIYAPGAPFNITFRNDEKRFDVEGADNISYEIVKKRIDKICIEGSTERLNQPGKIAIVYEDAAIKGEFLHHIELLQNEGILKENVEFLQLENLKDVFGLLAIRVEVQ